MSSGGELILPTQEMVQEIVSRGETYLQAQLSVATSNDQRAASMAGIFSPVALAVVAGLFSASPGALGAMYRPLLVSGAVTAILFSLASILCGLAVQPSDFLFPGTQPGNWDEDVQQKTPLLESLASLGKNYQDKINRNRQSIEQHADLFRYGLYAGIGAPIFGIALFGLLMLIESFYAR